MTTEEYITYCRAINDSMYQSLDKEIQFIVPLLKIEDERKYEVLRMSDRNNKCELDAINEKYNNATTEYYNTLDDIQKQILHVYYHNGMEMNNITEEMIDDIDELGGYL